MSLPFLTVVLVDDDIDSVGEGIRTFLPRRLRADLAIVADRRREHRWSILDEDRPIAAEHIAGKLDLGDGAALAGDLDAWARIVDELRILDADIDDLLLGVIWLEIDARARPRAARVPEHRVGHEHAVGLDDGQALAAVVVGDRRHRISCPWRPST